MKPEDLLLLVTREMPFGKHKGRLLPTGEIGRLLALMQEIDHNGLSGLLDPLRTKPRVPFKGQ
jgi:uncharacterized protein (DUF3820 family)